MCNQKKRGTQPILLKANLRTLSRDFTRVNTWTILDASDGELAPYTITLHADDDVQESERIGEVENMRKMGMVVKPASVEVTAGMGVWTMFAVMMVVALAV